jgi:hypothetical protein
LTSLEGAPFASDLFGDCLYGEAESLLWVWLAEEELATDRGLFTGAGTYSAEDVEDDEDGGRFFAFFAFLACFAFLEGFVGLTSVVLVGEGEEEEEEVEEEVEGFRAEYDEDSFLSIVLTAEEDPHPIRKVPTKEVWRGLFFLAKKFNSVFFH